MPDRASEVLEEGLPVGVPKSFRALADHGNVPRTTLQHRARGRKSNWTTFPTPGWHYAYSDKGYTDSYLSLQWLKLVFDPQTKELANQKPRVLLCDGFDTHQTLEVLEFCFENRIILCRFPSHTTHELQPCDVSVFKPLKDAYRDEVERLERGCVGKIGKEHFTSLYSPAREQVLTARTIRAGWSRAGLFPWNPEKVLSRIPKPAAEPTIKKIGDVEAGCCAPDQATVPQTPVTPVSTEAVTALHNLIAEDARMLDQSSRLRLQRHLQKLTNATHLSFDERALLREHNRFLAEINNEAKPRRVTKAIKLGTARVMSYKDLENARAERAAKEAKKEAASEARKAREAKKAADATIDAEQPGVGQFKRGVKRKRSTAAETPEPAAKEAKTSRAYAAGDESISLPWQAPVARMW